MTVLHRGPRTEARCIIACLFLYPVLVHEGDNNQVTAVGSCGLDPPYSLPYSRYERVKGSRGMV